MARIPCRSVLLLIAAVIVAGFSARFADAQGRAFAPVQFGFQPGAPIVAEHAPDRVLVKLTKAATSLSRVPSQLRFGQNAPSVTIGLARVDRVLSLAGARALSRAFAEPANRDEAEHLGLQRWLRVDIAGGLTAAETVEQLRALPEVQAVTLDYVAFPAIVPSDPLHSIHW